MRYMDDVVQRLHETKNRQGGEMEVSQRREGAILVILRIIL